MGQPSNPQQGDPGQDGRTISNISYDQTNQKFNVSYSDGSYSSFNYSVPVNATKGQPGPDLTGILINGNTITSTFKDNTSVTGTIDTSSIDTSQLKNTTLWCNSNQCTLPSYNSINGLTVNNNSSLNIGYFNPSQLQANNLISKKGQTNNLENGYYASYGNNTDGYLYQNSLTDKGLQLKNGSITIKNNIGEGPYQVKDKNGLCLDANLLNTKSNKVFTTCDDSNYNHWWYYNTTNGKLYNDNLKKCMSNMGNTNGTWGMENCDDSNGNQYFTRTPWSELRSGLGNCLSSTNNSYGCTWEDGYNTYGGQVTTHYNDGSTTLSFVPRFDYFHPSNTSSNQQTNQTNTSTNNTTTNQQQINNAKTVYTNTQNLANILSLGLLKK